MTYDIYYCRDCGSRKIDNVNDCDKSRVCKECNSHSIDKIEKEGLYHIDIYRTPEDDFQVAVTKPNGFQWVGHGGGTRYSVYREGLDFISKRETYVDNNDHKTNGTQLKPFIGKLKIYTDKTGENIKVDMQQSGRNIFTKLKIIFGVLDFVEEENSISLKKMERLLRKVGFENG